MKIVNSKLFVLCIISLVFLGSIQANAVIQEWAKVYDGGMSDYPQAIAHDSSGNAYVTGFGGSSDGWTVITVKYSPDGTQQWARHYDYNPGSNFGDWGNAIAVDSSGNVYVTGATDNSLNAEDILTIKYNTSGTFQWAVTYNSATSGYDEGHDIAVNSTTGDVYVTGRSAGNLIIIRYNSSGVQQFTNTYGATNGGGWGIALDPSGNVCVTGTDGFDYHTIKRNSTLNTELWSIYYNGSANGIDKAWDVDTDSSGNVYVTGESVASGAGLDCVTVKYRASDGLQLWARSYDYVSNTDIGRAIVVDSSGNAYVTGNSFNSTPDEDYITIMYDTSGTELWAKRYDNGDKDIAYSVDIDTESPPNVYVTGESDGGATQQDCATIMYDNSGTEKWVMRYNSNWDYGRDIAVYDKDAIYVACETDDYVTIKYSNTGTGEIVKWIQEPDTTENGIDIRCDRSDQIDRILADDFKCTTTGLITDVHFWGSWRGDPQPQERAITKIHLSIHSDDPVGTGGTDPDNTYSKPDQLLWQKDFYHPDFNESLYFTVDGQGEWWWDPFSGFLQAGADNQIWKYDIYIDPCDAFEQQGTETTPVIYWLDIYVETDQAMPHTEFGWKTRRWPDHFADDAVYGLPQAAGPPNWQELRYPPGHPYHQEPGDMNSIDMAFAITTQEEEEPYDGKPLVPHSKWSQPPIEIAPDPCNLTDPVYFGWDEQSHNKDLQQIPNIYKIVADDFRCIGPMPVTSIHWWGSHHDWINPDLQLPLNSKPDGWWIGFWSNQPAMTNPFGLDYSYPETLLHDFVIHSSRVDVNQVGTDEYFPGESPHPNDVCYQYYVDLNDVEMFKQDEYKDMTIDDVFWISIVALYTTDIDPDYPWGWKSRPWHWMDDSVTFNLSFQPGAGFMTDPLSITPIEDNLILHESYDMSFELDTDPNYIKWEQYYTGIRHWPHYEDRASMLIGPDPDNQTLIADDWRCLKRTPITSIVWWGSYIGYKYEPYGPYMSLPVSPDAFELRIWTDVAVGEDPLVDYSHPNEPVWTFMTNEYDEVLVGYDKHPHGEPNEPVFRYSVRLPETEWFKQPDYNEVFWLSVQAIYNDYPDPLYPWGWTIHKHVFNDDAVEGRKLPDDTWEWWREILDQTGASADMSFILFTDPRVCSPCANYNCDYTINFLDFADFADDWLWTGPAGGYNNTDLNCDGVGNFKDLAIFVNQWLTYCP